MSSTMFRLVAQVGLVNIIFMVPLIWLLSSNGNLFPEMRCDVHGHWQTNTSRKRENYNTFLSSLDRIMPLVRRLQPLPWWRRRANSIQTLLAARSVGGLKNSLHQPPCGYYYYYLFLYCNFFNYRYKGGLNPKKNTMLETSALSILLSPAYVGSNTVCRSSLLRSKNNVCCIIHFTYRYLLFNSKILWPVQWDSTFAR